MTKSNELSTQPYRGMQDFFPEDMLLRRYIFDTWRQVCERFGYEEYQTPLLEDAQLYRAKSGDEVGGKELFTLIDQGDRELAIRPEMTPSVTRLVARRYQQWSKPIRLFNISNFARQERPQRGRNREFWQLNFDIFGEDSLNADLEILMMALEIMLAFNPPQKSFVIKISNRILLNDLLTTVVKVPDQQQQAVTRLMDKSSKLDPKVFASAASELGLEPNQIELLLDFLGLFGSLNQVAKFEVLKDSPGVRQVNFLINQLKSSGYPEWAITFAPSLVRGFDYYDGMIFEVFDTNLENNRSLFGGGRYNGLANLFGQQNFPAVGCAPGDETLALFLQSWDLVPDFTRRNVVFVPLLGDNVDYYVDLSQQLRKKGLAVISGLEVTSVGDAVSEANKKNYSWVLIQGEKEKNENQFALKNMQTGEQQTYTSLEDMVKMVQSES
jgi:histidyl-tRNA synthetase